MYKFANSLGRRLPIRRIGTHQLGQSSQGGGPMRVGSVISLAGPSLGQSYQEWYNRAKAATTKFADLRDNFVPRIVDLRARADILEWLGGSFVDESPIYRWDTVMSDMSQAGRDGIAIYEVSRRTNRIVKLEDFVTELGQKVGAAGQLSAKPTPTPTPDTRPDRPIIVDVPDYTIPIVAAGGAVALAVLVGAIF